MNAEFFMANRERLRQLFTGSAPIVISANGALQQATDTPFTFYQDRSFWYLTGLDYADVLLVMDKDKEYLILPERSTIQDIFDGQVTEQSVQERSGIAKIYPAKEGWRQLGARLKRVKHVATLGANQVFMEHFGMYSNPARAQLIKRLQDQNPEIELLDLREHLARMRMVKQPVELEYLQRAIDITLDSLRDAAKPSKLAKYTHEYQLEAEIAKGFRFRGASGHAFAPVVAGGPRACTLHYVANNTQLQAGEFIVMDVGAEYDHYMADITRTVIHGEPTKRQRQVYDAVSDVQAYAMSLLKPGVMVMSYEHEVEQYMGEKLRELGLIKIIDSPAVRKYFPHATSHFLGLDTHDAGDYDHPIEPNVVLTVEPGIYIPEEGIGVRIEDDIIITADGCRSLSSRLPHGLD